MSQRFDFAIDVKSFAKQLEALGNRAPAIMARVVNRANVSGKTAMVRAVAKDTGIQQKAIERDLRIEKASRSSPRASIEIKGRRLPLIAFQARGPEPSRGRGRGVSWVNQGQRKSEPHAFIATVAGGHRGVFVRSRFTPRGYRPMRSNPKREAIVELTGPSLPHVFANFLPVFEAAALESFAKNMGHELSFATRAGGEGPL